MDRARPTVAVVHDRSLGYVVLLTASVVAADTFDAAEVPEP